MALNPDVQLREPKEYIAESRGFGPAPSADQSLGTLFEGIGQAVEGGIKLVDEGIKQNIYEEASGEIDAERNLFGADAATVAAGERDNPLGPTPPEITDKGSYLDRLNTAYMNGTITESYYYGRLNMVTKSLKSRYPGYEMEVDAVVQSIAGVNPANAVVSALRREAEAEASVVDQERKFQQQYIKENEEYIRMAFPDWQGLGDTSVSWNQITEATSRLKANEQIIQAETAEIGLQISRGNLRQQNVVSVARNIATNLAVTTMSGGLSGASNGFADLQSQITEHLKSGEPPTPEVLAQMANQANALKTNLEMTLRNQLMQPIDPTDPSKGSLWSHMNEQERKDVISAALGQVDSLTAAITSGDTNFVAINSMYIDASKSAATRNLLEQNDSMSNIIAAKEIFGEAAIAVWLAEPKNMTTFEQIMNLGQQAEVVLNPDSTDINQHIAGLEGMPQVDTAAATRAKIINNINTITSGEVTPEAAAASIKYLFANGQGLNLIQFPPEQRSRIFSMMVNPQVTARVQAMGDPELENKYYNWAARNFINNNRTLANNIKSNADSFSLFELNFNEASGTVELRRLTEDELRATSGSRSSRWNDPSISPGMRSGFEQALQDEMLGQFRELNLGLSSMKGIIEASGSTPQEFLLRGLGIELKTIDENKEEVPADGEEKAPTSVLGTPDEGRRRMEQQNELDVAPEEAEPLPENWGETDDGEPELDAEGNPLQMDDESDRNLLEAEPISFSPVEGVDIFDTVAVPDNGGAPRSRAFGGPRGSNQLHTALDIPAAVGTPVKAVADGEVVGSYRSSSGYGNVVDVRYSDGTVHRMAHLASRNVEVGDKVRAGQIIATAGHSGNASSDFPHVHYEVIKGEYYNAHGGRPPGRISGRTAASRAALADGRYDPREYFRQRSQTAVAAQ